MSRQDVRPTVFGQRPWLNKDGREIANRAARKMQRNPPDFVEDPDDVYLGDVLRFLAGSDGSDDDVGLLTDLLSNGLDYQEAIYWYLWNYCGLTPKEIHLSETGRCHADDWDDERPEIRAVEATLTVAGRKRGRTGHISDWDRTGHSDR